MKNWLQKNKEFAFDSIVIFGLHCKLNKKHCNAGSSRQKMRRKLFITQDLKYKEKPVKKTENYLKLFSRLLDEFVPNVLFFLLTNDDDGMKIHLFFSTLFHTIPKSNLLILVKIKVKKK